MEQLADGPAAMERRPLKARHKHVIHQLNVAVQALKEQLALQQQRRAALALRALALEHLTCGAAAAVLSLAVTDPSGGPQPATAAAAAAAAAAVESSRAAAAAAAVDASAMHAAGGGVGRRPGTVQAPSLAAAAADLVARAAQQGSVEGSWDPLAPQGPAAAAGVLSAAAIAAAADAAVAAAAAAVLGPEGAAVGPEGAADGADGMLEGTGEPPSTVAAAAGQVHSSGGGLTADGALPGLPAPTGLPPAPGGERRSVRKRRATPVAQQPAAFQPQGAGLVRPFDAGPPPVVHTAAIEQYERPQHGHPLAWCAQLSVWISKLLGQSTPSIATSATAGGGGLLACPWHEAGLGGGTKWGPVLDAVTGAKAQGLSLEEASSAYSAFITEALVLQALVGRDLGPEVWAVEARLNDGLRDGISWVLGAFLWRPTLVAELATHHLLRNAPADPTPSLRHWAECLRDAQPGSRQLSLLGSLRRVVRMRQGALTARWRRLASTLATATASPAASGGFAALTSAAEGLAGVLRAWEAEAAVQAVACLSVLTPRQALRACVRAYPYVPLPEDLLDHAQAACDAAAAEARAAAEAAARQRAAAEAAAAAAAAGDGPAGGSPPAGGVEEVAAAAVAVAGDSEGPSDPMVQ